MKPRVLFADDDPDIRVLMAAIFRDMGVDAVAASGGEAALDAYALARHEEDAFDLLMLDLAMPYTNGFEVASKIRAAGDTTTPILFMTGFEEEYDLSERAAELTPLPILHKPFTVQEFEARLESVLSEIVAVKA
jgi:DNA-binding response OmpR family regulator